MRNPNLGNRSHLVMPEPPECDAEITNLEGFGMQLKSS
jgi:hypothetical protein